MILCSRLWCALATRQTVALALFLPAVFAMNIGEPLAHNVTSGDVGYIQEVWGLTLIPVAYLRAKHMVTRYDDILFLLGVVFFLMWTPFSAGKGPLLIHRWRRDGRPFTARNPAPFGHRPPT